MFKKYFTYCILLSLFFVACSPNKNEPALEEPTPSGIEIPKNHENQLTGRAVGPWQSLLWEDFVGGSFADKWELINRADYNSSSCYYDPSVPVKGTQDALSCLVINATNNGSGYKSGMIKSKNKYYPDNNTELVFYAKIKLIAFSGPNNWFSFRSTYGAWPAFWTVEENGWPTKGEIDIMEGYSYGGTNRFASNLFYGTTTGVNTLGNSAERIYNPNPPDWQWNDYYMYWKNTNGVHTVTTYMNGTLMGNYSGFNINQFGPHNIILNLNVGSNSNLNIFNNSLINLYSKTMMWVDYVGVSKRTI